jgi:hypothetical protein
MMTVKELRELLEQFDDDAIVIIASDGEGNSFSPLADTSEGHYIPENGYSGDFVDLDDAEEDEDINLDDAERAILLWPTN